MRVVVSADAIAPDAEIGALAGAGQAGAMACFVGYCRGASAEGSVQRLVLEHYPGFTEAEITRLAEAAFQRHGLIDLVVVHRVGAIPAGEVIVLVAALSAHRAAAFAAVGELMDYLKTDAPIWKQEVGPGGARWIEPTGEDRARRASHDQKEPSS